MHKSVNIVASNISIQKILTIVCVFTMTYNYNQKIELRDFQYENE